MKSDLRMLFFVRTDLGMNKGKIAAQVGHAVQYLVYSQCMGVVTADFLNWISDDSTKICLKVNSEEELIKYFNLAKELEVSTTLVKDKGYTYFNGIETYTVVGWGPLKKETHEQYTKELKLL